MQGRSLHFCYACRKCHLHQGPLKSSYLQLMLNLPFRVLVTLSEVQLTSWAISVSIQDSPEIISSHWQHEALEAQMQSGLQIYLRAKHKKPRKKIPKLCRGMPMLTGISKVYQRQAQATQMTVWERGQLWVLGALRSATNSELSSACFGGGSECTSRVRHPTHQPVWESPNHSYSPPLTTWGKDWQGVSTVPESELIVWLAFLSGCPKEDIGRVWAHLALSSSFLRTLPHATSLSLELGV